MTSTNQDSYVYAGLAGETAPGRQVNSGLYRMSNNDGQSCNETGQVSDPPPRFRLIRPN